MGGLRERINQSRLSLLVPGDPETQTGGYIYDRRIVEDLRRSGWHVDVHSLDSSFPKPSAAALRHAGTVLAGLPDARIVVIDGLALGRLPEVLKPEAGRLRLVALIHHPLALETGLDAETARLFRESERTALTFVRRVIVTSRWTSRTLAADYGIAADRIRVVEPGVDAPANLGDSAARSGHDPLNLLCVATLTPRKGHAVLFDALARLRDRSWHLRCAGSPNHDPETANALGLQIDRLGLRARIELLGDLDAAALESHYASCDVFVLASYMEGYGMALAEAVAHGIPIISTLAGAIPETVPANASLLVPPGDEQALAQALATVMDEPASRQRLVINAIAASKSLPSWTDAALKFAAAIEDLEGDRQ